MATIYDYEADPQPGDMPYDQAEQAAEQTEWYGACGVLGCTDCLPRFDADNNEIPS